MADIPSHMGRRVLVVGRNAERIGQLLYGLRDMGIDCAAVGDLRECMVFLNHSIAVGARIDAIICERFACEAGSVSVGAAALGATGVPLILLDETSDSSMDTFEPYRRAKSSGVLAAVADLLRLHAGPATKIPSRPFADRRDVAANTAADILVAEDNDINQLVISQYLDTTAYTYKLVSNGRRAVHAFRNVSPRLILMDISMPEMSGKEATAAIRALEGASGCRVPIVALTAHALKGDREDCLAAGMDGYISKPIDFGALNEILYGYLGGSRRPAVNAA